MLRKDGAKAPLQSMGYAGAQQIPLPNAPMYVLPVKFPKFHAQMEKTMIVMALQIAMIQIALPTRPALRAAYLLGYIVTWVAHLVAQVQTCVSKIQMGRARSNVSENCLWKHVNEQAADLFFLIFEGSAVWSKMFSSHSIVLSKVAEKINYDCVTL